MQVAATKHNNVNNHFIDIFIKVFKFFKS
jgi:hypothetical protein